MVWDKLTISQVWQLNKLSVVAMCTALGALGMSPKGGRAKGARYRSVIHFESIWKEDVCIEVAYLKTLGVRRLNSLTVRKLQTLNVGKMMKKNLAKAAC